MAPARAAADVVLAGLGEELDVVAAASVAFDRFAWSHELEDVATHA
jgi:hypothetical protein